MSKINFLALGGLDEKNNHMYILEIDSKIYILDSGIYEPLNSTLGIKYYVPNINYLKENVDKIKGVFLSSANRQQIASIIQLINAFPNIKIYGSKITLDSLFIFFSDYDFRKNIEVLENGEKRNIGGIEVSIIELNSAIPGNFGYVFNTEDGYIYYFTDYLFDWIKEYNIPLIDEIKKYTNKKNLLFLSDSLNMNVEHSISPEYSIKKYVKDLSNTKKRIVSLHYEDEIINIIEMINFAKKNNKKVFVLDYKIKKLIESIFKNGYGDSYPIHIIDNYKSSDEKNSIIIITGTNNSLFKLVSKIIIENNSDWFTITKNDVVFFSSGPQPGNEEIFQNITSKISRIEPEIIIPDFERKMSIHPSQFDLKNYLKFLNPKYLLPIKGYYKEMVIVKDIAIDLGYKSENVIITENGTQIAIENGLLSKNKRKIDKVGFEIIENISGRSKTIDSEVIEERQQIGKDGVLTAFFSMSKETKKIISNIDIQMRGVIYIKNQENLVSKLENEIRVIIEENEDEKNLNKIISMINKSFAKILRSSIKKIPKIIIKIKIV